MIDSYELQRSIEEHAMLVNEISLKLRVPNLQYVTKNDRLDFVTILYKADKCTFYANVGDRYYPADTIGLAFKEYLRTVPTLAGWTAFTPATNAEYFMYGIVGTIRMFVTPEKKGDTL